MLSKRAIIYHITIAVILLAAITAGSLHYVSQQRQANEIYNNCKPYQYIASPQEAYVYIIGNHHKLAWNCLPLLNPTSLPHKDILKSRSTDGCQPLYIAQYPDNNAAIWCAIRDHEREQIANYIADSLCNGYTPVKEKLAYGTILHFSTHDNRFLHLFYNNGVMGISYSEKLVMHSPDSNDLCSYIESQHNIAYNRLIYNNNYYKYCRLYSTKEQNELHFTTEQCHIAPLSEAAPIDTASISTSAKGFIQMQTAINKHLAQTATLIYKPSIENPDTLVDIYTARITDRRKLLQELYSVYTRYGYRTDSTTATRWIPKSFISHSNYWIAVGDSTMYAAHSYKELKSYIAEIQQGKCINIPQDNQASLYIASCDTVTGILPQSITQHLPAIAQEADTIIVDKTSEGYKWVLRFNSHTDKQ